MSNNVSDTNIRTRKLDSIANNGSANSAANNGVATNKSDQEDADRVNIAAKLKDEPPRFVAPPHGGVDILKLLTELEDLVEHTKHGPLGIMIGFPEDQFHMTIMKIRANLPEEMKRASKLVREQERIVEEAREGIERIKEESRRAATSDLERSRNEVAQLRETTAKEMERARTAANDEINRMREAAEREAQRILAESQAQGLQMIEEARAQASHLVSDGEILHQAQTIAQDIQLRAEHEAMAVRRGADDYARDVLVNLETILGKATAQVQRGRELLERPR